MRTLVFKYGTSRGRDTYGYNLVTLRVDGRKVAQECGGGYDMQGAALGTYITEAYQDALKTLDPAKFYGLREWDGKMRIDGACGMSSVERIISALGLQLSKIRWASNNSQETYFLQ